MATQFPDAQQQTAQKKITETGQLFVAGLTFTYPHDITHPPTHARTHAQTHARTHARTDTQTHSHN